MHHSLRYVRNSHVHILILFHRGKVRLQIQGEGGKIQAGKPYKGMVDMLLRIPREEGFRSLFGGLSAGLQRQVLIVLFRILIG